MSVCLVTWGKGCLGIPPQCLIPFSKPFSLFMNPIVRVGGYLIVPMSHDVPSYSFCIGDSWCSVLHVAYINMHLLPLLLLDHKSSFTNMLF